MQKIPPVLLFLGVKKLRDLVKYYEKELLTLLISTAFFIFSLLMAGEESARCGSKGCGTFWGFFGGLAFAAIFLSILCICIKWDEKP